MILTRKTLIWFTMWKIHQRMSYSLVLFISIILLFFFSFYNLLGYHFKIIKRNRIWNYQTINLNVIELILKVINELTLKLSKDQFRNYQLISWIVSKIIISKSYAKIIGKMLLLTRTVITSMRSISLKCDFG